MRRFLLTLAAVAVCAVPVLAQAQDVIKWFQPPDEQGWDVKVTSPKVLADDFLCTSSLPITGVHFWGSWQGDEVGTITNVHLSIHADKIGAVPSQPGDLLWERDFDQTVVDTYLWMEDTMQGWYDPNTLTYLWPDHSQIWFVDIWMPDEDWFWQEGTLEDPVVYWLDIQVTVEDPLASDFGWKTSWDHWRDDATWRDTQWPADWWEKLVDPVGETLDMAFVLTTIPEPGVFVLAGLGLLALLGVRRRK